MRVIINCEIKRNNEKIVTDPVRSDTNRKWDLTVMDKSCKENLKVEILKIRQFEYDTKRPNEDVISFL